MKKSYRIILLYAFLVLGILLLRKTPDKNRIASIPLQPKAIIPQHEQNRSLGTTEDTRGSTEIQDRVQRLLAENKRYPQPPEARHAQRHGAEAKITLRVTDSLGAPVKDAVVYVTLYPEAEGVGSPVKRLTDANGMLIIEGLTKSYIDYALEKDGYYPNPYARYLVYNERLPTCVKDGKWFPWNPTVEVTFKEVRNPVQMVTKFLVEKELPHGEELGFDFQAGDWVGPHGKGVYPDFTMVHVSKNSTWEDLDNQLLITMKANEGFLQMPLDAFSQFRSVYEAPLSGYDPNIKLEKKNKDGRSLTETRIPEDHYLVFRTRAKADEKGNLIQSHYGKIYGFQYGHNDLTRGTGYVRFTYYFNPNENDRNLECKETWLGR